MKLNIRNQKNVIASLAKQSMTFVALVWVLLSLVFFAACSDFGDRNNPLDPGAGNYVAQNDDSKSSSSSVILSSSEESSTSRSSSSIEEQKFSSSSKIFEPAKGPSSSSIKDEFSSFSIIPDSVPTSVSSSSNKASSSSDVVFPSSSENLRSSSSSEEQSFSSSSKISEPVEMSSSSLIPWLCGNSTLTRGDYEYKTVVIKEQCWTKENLRYVPSTGHTMCYGDKKENCEIYGRLYDYEAASLACPTGWRLPTSAEYEALAEYSMEGATLYDAGAHFKSTSGWTPENGDDFLEFTALPGGKCNEDQTCQNIGTMGYWWTSTEKVKNTSHLILALNGDGDSYSATNKMDNDQYISVRCVKK